MTRPRPRFWLDWHATHKERVELVLLLAAAGLTLALTGPGAVALDNLLQLERRFQECDRADLMPSRG